MKKLKKLNLTNLVQDVFPYTKGLEILNTVYLKKGFAEWPTWYITLNYKAIGIHYLLMICGSSSRTKMYNIDDLDLYERNNHMLNDFEAMELRPEGLGLSNPQYLELNESYRLYKFLKRQGIILFEPTRVDNTETPSRKANGFCETPEEKCTMNYCDENGCQNRKRHLTEDGATDELTELKD